jgi:hypothetical protein
MGRSIDSNRRARQFLVDQICALAGGPCFYPLVIHNQRWEGRQPRYDQGFCGILPQPPCQSVVEGMLGPEYKPGRGWQTRIDHKRSDFLQSPDGLFCVAALQFDRGNAALELSRRNSSRALDLLQATTPYELGDAGMFINNVYPAYLRGQAYLLARNGPAAAAEFQQMLDHKGIVLNSVTGYSCSPSNRPCSRHGRRYC